MGFKLIFTINEFHKFICEGTLNARQWNPNKRKCPFIYEKGRGLITTGIIEPFLPRTSMWSFDTFVQEFKMHMKIPMRLNGEPFTAIKNGDLIELIQDEIDL